MAASVTVEALENYRRFQENLRWAKSHSDQLEQFSDRYVAIDGGKVLAAAAAKDELALKFESRPGVYITFVTRKGLSWIL